MAKKAKAGVRLSGRFSPGTEVELHRRVGAMFDRAHLGTAIATSEVDKLGAVAFEDLDVEPGTPMWISGVDEDDVWRGVAVTAKSREAAGGGRMDDDEIRERLAQTRPPATAVQATTTTGARSTSSTRVVGGNGQPFAHPKVGIPTPEEQREESPAPYPRIEDVEEGTVLRSHTVTGEAHPVDLEVPDGQLRQDQVSEDVFQASCTPLGTATVLPVQPGVESEPESVPADSAPAEDEQPEHADEEPQQDDGTAEQSAEAEANAEASPEQD